MKSTSNQVSVYELREARSYAGRLSFMVARDIWYAKSASDNQASIENPFPLPELSVKESNRKEIGEDEARTVFTFRFEGGTVVRVTMYGAQDSNYGFQWWIESADLRFYKCATDSAYPSLAEKKSEIHLDESFFQTGYGWWKNQLPVTC